MIKVYTGFKSYAMLLFLTAGVVLVVGFLVLGVAGVIEFLLPLLIVMSYLAIIVFLLGFLPATFIKGLRPMLGEYSLLMSYALGMASWLMSFFFVVKAFGFWGIFLALLMQYLAPIALVGAIVKGAWHIAGHLILWVSFAFGMKFYSLWLSNLSSRKQHRGDIIDVDAVEV